MHARSDQYARHPEGNPGTIRWFLGSIPIQMPPELGSICGRLTYGLSLGYLQGGSQPALSPRVVDFHKSPSFDKFERLVIRRPTSRRWPSRCTTLTSSSSLLLSILELSDTKSMRLKCEPSSEPLTFQNRCQANQAHIRQSVPEYDPGSQKHQVEPFKLLPVCSTAASTFDSWRVRNIHF
jgi:hypothetical protein